MAKSKKKSATKKKGATKNKGETKRLSKEERRKRLHEQAKKEKERLSTGGGIIIDDRSIDKLKLRIPPCSDFPGADFTEIYCPSLGDKGKSSTSPRSFGQPCPVMDLYEKVKNEGTQKDFEHVQNVIRPRSQRWIPVIDRNDPGDADEPKIKILRCRRSPWAEVVNRLAAEDEDEFEDVTDPDDGRDFIYKAKGQGRDRRYELTFANKASPISKDEPYKEAILEKADDFRVEDRFFRPNWETLREIYEHVTGDDMPEEYENGEQPSEIPLPKSVASDEDEDDEEEEPEAEGDEEEEESETEDDEEETEDESEDEEESEEDSESEDEEEGDDESESDEDAFEDDDEESEEEVSDDEGIARETRVKIPTDDGDVSGTVLRNVKKDGEIQVVVEDEDGEEWYAGVDELEVQKPTKKGSSKKKKTGTKKSSSKKSSKVRARTRK